MLSSGLPRLPIGISGEPLVNLKFVPPQTVVVEEGDACEKVMLIASGKLEFFRRIKECKDKASIAPSNFKMALELKQGVKELKNAYGDSVLIKDISSLNPYSAGEENVLLNIRNPFTIITRSYVPILEFNLVSFFKLI